MDETDDPAGPRPRAGGPASEGSGRGALFGATTLLSALLLFLVQPIMGKRILPWFGGVASVWTACLLFFQVALVAGYLYCHWVTKHLSPRRQSIVHVALLVASCATLPIELHDRFRPDGGGAPLASILGLLATSVGLPYFALSTTGPLMQVWFAREKTGRVPYGLFALSNLGSMVALLSYPIVVEPMLGARAQSVVWSVGFGVFAVLCAVLAWRAGRATGTSGAAFDAPGPAPSWGTVALWTLLSACPSILLIGMTRSLSLDVAPVPLLWVLPLAAYLLSFIVCFGRPGWYARSLFGRLFVLALCAVVWLPPSGPSTIDIRLRVAVYLAALFAFSMTGHGELVRLRPAPRHLTTFYLTISIGGALGTAFAGVLGPAVLPLDLELPIGVVLMTAVLFFVHLRGPGASAGRFQRARIPLAAVALIALGAVILQDPWRQIRGAVAVNRSFYATLRVADTGTGEAARRTLSHGRTVHGSQFLDPVRSRWPIGYYSETSGAGVALQLGEGQRPRRIGMIGLGAGALLAYGRPGDDYRVYEIDGLVVDFARRYFTYLPSAEAQVSVVLGDGRLALTREPEHAFDVLVVDAFSGDAVPTHLLTREAFALYRRHLGPDGILAVHISSRFLDLAPVVKLSAEANDLDVALVKDPGDEARGALSSTWALAARPHGPLEREGLLGRAEAITDDPSFRMWTDDDSSLLSVLR